MNKIKKGSADNPKHEAKRAAKRKRLRIIELKKKFPNFK